MIDRSALQALFLDARTHSAWQEKEVDDELLIDAFNLAKMAPTSANCQPMRIIFVKSLEAKNKLKPHLAEGNVEKTMTAPVCAIIAHDMEFYNELPRLFPHTDAKSWFVGNDAMIEDTAFRNATLQAGYFILACRALGLDCGPMSGFDQAGVDKTFFEGTAYKSNFLINIGYGDADALHPRSPRPEFNEFCEIA